MHDLLNFGVKGHVLIQDDLGNVLVDKDNAIHPQNMARIIARGLANEANSTIYRIAFGNGGTTVDAAFTVTYKTPNTGQDGNVNQTFDSRLYNETYSEIVDETLGSVGTDPGSSDSTGTRPAGGGVPSGDSGGVGVVSGELGITSSVVITAELNSLEPTGQNGDGLVTNTEDAFVFDEIGLYTNGLPAAASAGTADIDVGARISEDDSGLVAGTTYSFGYSVDGNAPTTLTFTVPPGGGSGVVGGSGTEFTYGDLCELLNTSGGASQLSGTKVFITDRTTSYPSITGANTSGKLRFVSNTTGSTSSVVITAGTINDMITALSATAGSAVIATPTPGLNAGDINTQERLLTHLIFAPVLKSANRTLLVTYTLTIAVAPTVN